MAKKQNSGLGRGLDSLIPKIDDIETDVEEGVSLEDLLKKSEEADEEKEETIEKIEEEPKVEETEETAEEIKEEILEEVETVEEDKKDEEVEEVEEAEPTEAIEDSDDESSEYTNIFNNDDEKSEDENDEEISSEISDENIKSTTNLKEETKETIKNIEAETKIDEVPSLLSEKEEQLVDEVIETVENNPRITLWSARSAAVLRYLRKTEPEFSISSEASELIDKAIAEKYPEIWTLFNHL